jgi:hypothetical protein
MGKKDLFSKQLKRAEEIIDLKKEISQYDEEIRKRNIHILADWSHVKDILPWFDERNGQRDVPMRKGSVYYRDVFLMIVLLLYFPERLSGYGKIPSKTRDYLADILGCNPTGISKSISRIMFLVSHDISVKRDFAFFAQYIEERIPDEWIDGGTLKL